MKRITLPITNQQLATEYLGSDITAEELGAKYGVSKPTILSRLKTVDCKMRKPGAHELGFGVTAEQLRVEYELPTTLIMLAKKYGCDPSAIRYKVLKAGGKMRAKKELGGQTMDLPLTDNEIVMRYNTGNTIPQIADECACSIPTIHRRLRDNDCKMRTCGMQRIGLIATGEELATKYNAGATTYSLAEENGCDRNTIRNRLLDHGAVLRARDSDDGRRIQSAALQGVPYDEWEGFAIDSPYCPKFNEACRESNRWKYGRRCFITGKPEADNITKTGKHRKLSVHHVDMNKEQGCNGRVWKLVPLGVECHGSAHGVIWAARIEYLLEHVWYPDGVWTPDSLC